MIRKLLQMSKGRWFYGMELVVDTMIIAFSYLIGYCIQRPNLFPHMAGDVAITIAMICCISVFFFLVFKTYRCGKKMYMHSMFDLILALAFIAMASILLDFVIKGIGVWRRTIFYAGIIQIIIFSVYKYFIVKIHALVIKPQDCIIIGKNLNEAAKIAIKLVNSQSHLYRLKYIFKQNVEVIYKYIKGPALVLICSSCDMEEKTSLIEYCAVHNIDCAVIPSVGDIIINSGKTSNINDLLLFRMAAKMDIESKLAKRITDLIISSIGIIVTFPLMLIVYLIIFAQDKANPLFFQTRLKRDNVEFKIVKFRTMVKNAEQQTGAILATHDDRRITKFGKLLRASRIDELPQLFNVFRGDMSIVGPRPERPELADIIIDELPEFKYRTLVKPGLTGYAQVIGRYNTDFRDKLLLDLYYVNNYSLLLDFRIMFNTLRILFTPSVTEGISFTSEEVDLKKGISSKGYSVEYRDNYIVFKNNNIK